MSETSRNRSDLRESLSSRQEALPNDENKRIHVLVKINHATTTKSQSSRQFSLIPLFDPFSLIFWMSRTPLVPRNISKISLYPFPEDLTISRFS